MTKSFVTKIMTGIAAGIMTLSLTGCGPDNGVVMDKEHHEGYWYTTTICQPIGKTTSCHPQMQYMPPSWDLLLRPDKGDTDWRDVSEEEYDACHVNDIYPECAKGVDK